MLNPRQPHSNNIAQIEDFSSSNIKYLSEKSPSEPAKTYPEKNLPGFLFYFRVKVEKSAKAVIFLYVSYFPLKNIFMESSGYVIDQCDF
ncbi:MAG: hypothetical protein E7052_08655 [Lentisphaerae bacterium]|nr:hypothetical protein [Lentisphaerota bacterium]